MFSFGAREVVFSCWTVEYRRYGLTASERTGGRPVKPMPEPIPDTPQNIRDILMRAPTQELKVRLAARSKTDSQQEE